MVRFRKIQTKNDFLGHASKPQPMIAITIRNRG
jgi:hypothetical protein